MNASEIMRGHPWGSPTYDAKLVAPGIAHCHTPGHGGYGLSPELHATMPGFLKACSFTGDRFFEEDCSWCAVLLAWPEHFTPDQVNQAAHAYSLWYAQHHSTRPPGMDADQARRWAMDRVPANLFA